MPVQTQFPSVIPLNQPLPQASPAATQAQNVTPVATPTASILPPTGQFEVLRGSTRNILSDIASRTHARTPVPPGVQHENIHESGAAGGNKAADSGPGKELRPVLDALKKVAPPFEQLPGGWKNGISTPPEDVHGMQPDTDN
jgi:hypothetical protein